MVNKPAYTITDQIALLKQRGMIFCDENSAHDFLANINYYRLRGYWWDMQSDYTLHTFKPDTYFEDVIERYDFDRCLRLILFDAIERIEIALRTRMIYHLSISYGGLWYLNSSLFDNTTITANGKTVYQNALEALLLEIERSQEIFIREHFRNYPNQPADAWKFLEVASMGTLSKLYRSLENHLPEKSVIANEMGINSPPVFSGWMESIVFVRNIIAHHSRLWGYTMKKTPAVNLNNPTGQWFVNPLVSAQLKKPFLIISCMIYLCNKISPGHHIKNMILKLIDENPTVPIYKLGFLNNWHTEPLWMH